VGLLGPLTWFDHNTAKMQPDGINNSKFGAGFTLEMTSSIGSEISTGFHEVLTALIQQTIGDSVLAYHICQQIQIKQYQVLKMGYSVTPYCNRNSIIPYPQP
jgi:hypothetical protein